MPFEFQPLRIPGLTLIQPQVFRDQRGFFKEVYKLSSFFAQGIPEQFLQDNFSFSKQGVIRGLHYQLEPKAQGKLIIASQGEIFDVAVDLRQGSATFGEWLGIRLSSENHHMLYIPPGFAHGFQVLSSQALITYKVTMEYAPEFERGILWRDPSLGINWPLSPPILNSKDQQWPTIQDAEHNFTMGEARA